MITLRLTDGEYRGLIEFLTHREHDIINDLEDLGLLLPLLQGKKTRVLWTTIDGETPQ